MNLEIFCNFCKKNWYVHRFCIRRRKNTFNISKRASQKKELDFTRVYPGSFLRIGKFQKSKKLFQNEESRKIKKFKKSKKTQKCITKKIVDFSWLFGFFGFFELFGLFWIFWIFLDFFGFFEKFMFLNFFGSFETLQSPFETLKVFEKSEI